jgi:hypothetical protein
MTHSVLSEFFFRSSEVLKVAIGQYMRINVLILALAHRIKVVTYIGGALRLYWSVWGTCRSILKDPAYLLVRSLGYLLDPGDVV